MNPLETVDDDDQYDIVFQNESLSSALPYVPSQSDSGVNVEEKEHEKSQFIRRAVFKSKQLSRPFSIFSIANNRYSEQMLSQVELQMNSIGSAQDDST